MPAISANAKNFLVNTDYPFDKVIYTYTGSKIMSGGSTETITHGLPFTPLIVIVWSYSSDFSVTYDDNTGPFPSSSPFFPFDLQVTAYATPTSIQISSNGPAAAATVYYRIFAYEPSTSTADLPFTVNNADNFSLDTDNNVPKLYLNDSVLVSSGASTTVSHGLGYIPQVQAWAETVSTGSIYPMSFTALDGFSRNIQVSTSQLIIKNDSLSNSRIHYRVYFDD